MDSNARYCDYFDIDEGYFPQINDSTISEQPDCWKRTFPHQTFIEMLKSMERCLSRQEKRSLWIEGAYGTGKSQCAYTLKKLLEVPEDEIREYWSSYKPLDNQTDLLEKIIGHKQKKIITTYRYASGGINSPRSLFYSIQESIKNVLLEKGLYVGENTLKDSVVTWLEEPSHKQIFEILLNKPEWKSSFSQSSVDEIISSLQKGGEIKNLMDNLFRVADKEGITALDINADRLIAWITDVIDRNQIKIVFIWDEFSDYFKNNRDSLSEFQKLAELVNAKPFFFVMVTHESGQLFNATDSTWTKIRDRFVSSHITLPDNIAFNLIGHALNINKTAQELWDKIADTFNKPLDGSRNAVMRATGITDQQVMKDILPLHPMAALVLKNIAEAFKSNQRSMFDFIKSTNTEDTKAFQWFIKNTGPYDSHPLLTINMLWNFFYEKGRDYLSPEIRLILDVFPQQQHLRDDEQAVLKAILILQAIDQRLGGSIGLLKATDQNLSYVFEGVNSGLDTACKGLAKALVNKGILVSTPSSNGQHVYQAAVLAGDQTKIDTLKKDIREKVKTQDIVVEGGLSTVLSLSPALKLRYEIEAGTGKITPITLLDYKRILNTLRDKSADPNDWRFHAVIAFAKDDSEAISFRNAIKECVKDQQYERIVFIDALSTPLGEAFESYVEYSAMSTYYQGNNNAESKSYADKARKVLDLDWKNSVYNGQFIIYTYNTQEGEKIANAQGVNFYLQAHVLKRFPDIFDFSKGLTENQLKLTPAMKQSGKSGILQNTSGVVVGIEKHILVDSWNVDKYWEIKPLLQISRIKLDVDSMIELAFEKEGQISFDEIYDFLEKQYGFAPCNLSAFLTGFLLKEYAVDPYRYADSTGAHESMSHEKLAEMIGNYIGKPAKATYIVKMTKEEMAFYEFTAKAWKISPNACMSVTQTSSAILNKMRNLRLPVWCLSEVDKDGLFIVIEKYIELVLQEGSSAHKKAIEIGKYAVENDFAGDYLKDLITEENCQRGMLEYLKSFDAGKALALASEIGADETILQDITKLFDVKHACLWNKENGEDEIRKLIVQYSVVKESNIILHGDAHSLTEAFRLWREKLKFLGVSYEALKSKFPKLDKTIDLLLKIYQQADILPDQLKTFLNEISSNVTEIRELFSNDKLFAEIYALYLDRFSESDLIAIKSKLRMGMFELSQTDCNVKVKDLAEEFRKQQLKTKLQQLWKEKTGTKDPKEWSRLHKIPILSLVCGEEYEVAKKTFDTINRNWSNDNEIRAAIEYIETTKLFEILNSDAKLKEAFKLNIIGEYSTLVSDEQALESLERLTIEPYNWHEHPDIRKTIKKIAEAEYNAGGSEKALLRIDSMDDAQLKQYLKRLVKDNMAVGIEIITKGE